MANTPASSEHSNGPVPMELDALQADYDDPSEYMQLAAVQQRNRRQQQQYAGQHYSTAERYG